MIQLESGPARIDKLYWLVVGLAFLAFSLWFLYDGLYGYPAKNAEKAREQLATLVESPEAMKLGETPTEEDYQRLVKMAPTRREQVEEVLGKERLPVRELRDGSRRMEYFASKYGMAMVPITEGGMVDARAMDWRTWYKGKSEVQQQFYWAIIPGVLSLYFFYRALKAARLRAVLDEEGMTYGGQRIAYADMTALRDYNRKGWVDLYYRKNGGERKLRIDNQKIAKFDEITALLSEKKGWENPVQAAEEDEIEDAQPADEAATPEGAEQVAPPGRATAPEETGAGGKPRT